MPCTATFCRLTGAPTITSPAAQRVDAIYQAGVAEWQAGRLDQAARLAREAIALEPELPALRFLLGSVLLDGGRIAEAGQAFDHAVALQPAYPLGLECAMRAALCRARMDSSNGVEPSLEILPGGKLPLVSVIVCSVTQEKFERVESEYRRLLAAVPHEIVGIHDARSLAEGYDRGLARSRGDMVVFSHDDVEIVSPDLAARLLRHLEDFELVGVAGTTKVVTASWLGADWPHLRGQIAMPGPGAGLVVTAYGAPARAVSGVQALDGVWFAARRDLAQRIGFDPDNFDGWHGYDFDFSFRCHLAGARCAVAGDLLLIHHSQGTFDAHWEHYSGRAISKHRGALPSDAGMPRQPHLCAVEVESALEWRLMNEELIAAANRSGGDAKQ